MDNNKFPEQNQNIPEHYVSIEDPSTIETYTAYLSYRVQRDFFEICRENGDTDCTWREFREFLSATEEMRTLCAAVVRKTLREFLLSCSFHFDAVSTDLIRDSDLPDLEEDKVRFIQIFTPEEGRDLIGCFFFRAELIYYHMYLSGLPWEDYVAELRSGGPMWRKVTAAVQDALSRTDFKPVWRLDDEEAIRS